jgi:septal ring factor EnvC (AmiA/AmiB activator)
MRRHLPKLLKLFAHGSVVLFLLALGPAFAQEDEETQTRAQLEKLRHDMAALSGELERDVKTRGSLQSDLRDSELAIGRTRKNIEQTRKRLQQAQSKLAQLRRQRQELLISRNEQQQLIGREIQMAYQMGRQGQLKLLLNQERPDTLARSMAYYEYFYAARQDHIERYLEILAGIDKVEPDIVATTFQLETSRTTLDEQERQLVSGKQQRQRDLGLLNKSISGKDARLQKMAVDREELERLLEVIEEAVAELRLPPQFQDFASQKGAMYWPVTGNPSNRYGGRRSGSQMRWRGLMIPAIEGSNVASIHHGRVVFADWFRGSGLLLIIDHGDGYMSLYAHNQALLREVGEWVSGGSLVALVGNSGGAQEAALYFEIRHDGKPINPNEWMSRG